MTHPMPEAHVSLLWDAIRQRPLYDPKRKRMTYNYKWVSAHSRDICGAHWSETAVRNVPRRLDAPAKVSGRKRKPHLQPEAIPRISSLISDAASTEMTQADLLRTVNADGGPEIKRSSFQRLLPSVRLLAETPSVRYSDRCFEDMTDLVRQIRFNSRSVVRVGAYVLTYKPLVAALLDLIRERPAVEVRILYDRRFCYSSADTLEAIVMLARAGATVKHLRSYSMHIKMVCVDNSYCWSGSGNFGESAITRNAELNTEIIGNVADACDIFDKYFDGGGRDEKWHQSVQPTELELDEMSLKALQLRERQASDGQRDSQEQGTCFGSGAADR